MAHFTKITPEDLLEGKVKLSDIDPLSKEDIGISILGRKKGKIPTWYAFLIYFLTGSSNKATDYLKDIGVVTKRDKYLSPNVVLFSAWEWLFYHMDWARKFIQRDFVITDRPFTEEEFSNWMFAKAIQYKVAMPDKDLVPWLDTNGLNDEKWIEKLKEKRPEVYRYYQTRSN